MIIDFSAFDPVNIWLTVCAVAIAVEAFGLSGIGLAFAGIAALLVALLIKIEALNPENLTIQTAVWFALTVLIAIVLWKPMKKWRMNPDSEDSFDNMVGDTATLEGDLNKGEQGKAKWSGAAMTAEIHTDSTVDFMKDGSIVEIKEVTGTILLLVPRN